MKRALLGALLSLLGAMAARSETMALREVTRGSLLFETDVQGRFEPAPLLATDVHMRVTGLIARVAVKQKFRNPTAEWLEGVYVFPLPPEAAVDTLRMRVGERLIEGQVKEKEEAKKTYQQASREGKKASLLEQERPNIFTLSVANLGPQEEVEVELEYQQILHYEQGEFRIRFPMVVGPRYVPGSTTVTGFSGTGWAQNTDRVPDAARITPPVLKEGAINPISLSVDLDAGFALRKLQSSFHSMLTENVSPTRRSLTLAEKTVPADRDFELVWAPEVGHEPQAALFTEKVEGESYALMMVMPPEADAAVTRLPRETIFVVDTSGSMNGDSIEQAKLALGEALSSLKPQDRFNVIQFNSYMEKLFPASVVAGAVDISGARRYVAGLTANGGTEMLPAFRAALEAQTEEGPVRQVIFITDGCVGNEDELFATLQKNLSRSRLFTVGIGSAPNSHFMSKAAQFGRGTYTYVGSPTEVAEKMGALFKKLESPVLTEIEAGFEASGVEAWPARIPDLYVGEPVVLVAKLPRETGGTLRVKGRRGETPWEAHLTLSGGHEGRGITKLWARKKISSLMDGLASGADREQVRRAVIDVALEHHLVSSYTSLVAVDVTPTRPIVVETATRPVPTNLPAGWVHESVFGALPRGGTPGTLYIALGMVFFVAALLARRAAPAGGR